MSGNSKCPPMNRRSVWWRRMMMTWGRMRMTWRTRTGRSNPDARLWLITHCFLSRNSALICGPIPPFFIICWPILTFFNTGTILYSRTPYNAIPWHSTPYNHTKQCHFIPYVPYHTIQPNTKPWEASLPRSTPVLFAFLRLSFEPNTKPNSWAVRFLRHKVGKGEVSRKYRINPLRKSHCKGL